MEGRLRALALIAAMMIIPVASAAVLYSISIAGTVTVIKSPIIFLAGTDGVATLNTNKTAASLNLNMIPDGWVNYTDPLHVYNQGSSTMTYQLKVTSITGATADVDYLVIQIVNASNGYVFDTLYVVQAGTVNSGAESASITIQPGVEHIIKVYVRGKDGILAGDTVNFQIALIAQ